MNLNQLNAHDRHYESDMMHGGYDNRPDYNSALFEAFNAAGFITIQDERNDFITKLWELGYAIAPLDRQLAINSIT